MADEIEQVRIPTGDLMLGASLQNLYAGAHPCSCGHSTMWGIVRIVWLCRCPACGKTKEFEWTFYESGEKTIEGCLKLMGMK
jgi:hypothetical protein